MTETKLIEKLKHSCFNLFLRDLFLEELIIRTDQLLAEVESPHDFICKW